MANELIESIKKSVGDYYADNSNYITENFDENGEMYTIVSDEERARINQLVAEKHEKPADRRRMISEMADRLAQSVMNENKKATEKKPQPKPAIYEDLYSKDGEVSLKEHKQTTLFSKILGSWNNPATRMLNEGFEVEGEEPQTMSFTSEDFLNAYRNDRMELDQLYVNPSEEGELSVFIGDWTLEMNFDLNVLDYHKESAISDFEQDSIEFEADPIPTEIKVTDYDNGQTIPVDDTIKKIAKSVLDTYEDRIADKFCEQVEWYDWADDGYDEEAYRERKAMENDGGNDWFRSNAAE